VNDDDTDEEMMRFDNYVKKDKLSSYVCFLLTDQNTINEFLTKTVSITSH